MKVSTQLQSLMLRTTKQARNLGVIMDSDLNLKSHIKHKKTPACYQGLQDKSQQDLETLVLPIVMVCSQLIKLRKWITKLQF